MEFKYPVGARVKILTGTEQIKGKIATVVGQDADMLQKPTMPYYWLMPEETLYAYAGSAFRLGHEVGFGRSERELELVE